MGNKKERIPTGGDDHRRAGGGRRSGRAPTWLLYVAAVAATIAAAGGRVALEPVLGNRGPYWPFLTAVVFVALLGGLGPGLVTTLLGAIVADLMFVEPRYSLGVHHTHDAIGLGFFVFIGLSVSALSGSQRRARRRAERATTAASAKDVTVRNVLERTTDAVAVLDRDWRYVHANERAAALAGTTPAKLLGRSLWEVFPDTVGSEQQNRFVAALRDQTPDRFESYYAPLNLWTETQVFPSPDGATLFITDTTARHAAARQRTVLAAINEAARSSTGDREEVACAIVSVVGRLLGVNRCTVADVDLKAGVLRVLRDYVDGVDSFAGSRALADLGPFVGAEMRAGRTIVVDDVSTDRRLDAPTIAWLAAHRVAALVAIVVTHDDRAVGYFDVHSAVPRVWSVEDVSLVEQSAARAWSALESARAAVELRQSEERLRLALDAGNLGVWDWDVRSNRVTWSDRIFEFYGIPRSATPHPIEASLAMIHPEDRPKLRAAMDLSLASDAPYKVEYRAIRPGGEVRWIYSNGSVFRDESGRPARVVGASIDVTDRKRLDEQRDQMLDSERWARADAERAGRMKDEFLATLSHELRTPLNAILGWSQLIRSGRLPEDELQHGLETVERNARVQTQLIDDLLDMSRIVSGKVRLEVQRVNLSDVVTAAVATVRPAADAREIVLHSSLDTRSCAIAGDPNRLQQVVWNLLSNAIKFTPRGGRVNLAMRVRDPDGHVEIDVTDSGQGITREFLPHVFDRFRQADATTTRRHGGLGLGLSIVKHLVEMHGGTVAAASDGPSTGATFTITLPLAAPQEIQSADFLNRGSGVAMGNFTGELTLSGVKVLVVDDEPDVRDLLRRLLIDRGAEVRVADCAEDAIATLNREWPLDVIVSDIGLPGEDGYSMIRKIRARDAKTGGKVPAIAVTAYARAEDRTHAILAGYQVHLTKPVEPSELIANVASLVGRTGAAAAVAVG